MPQNYKVARGQFGQYKSGSVLPEYVVKQAGDVAEMVKRRVLEPTSDPVNVRLVAPKVQVSPTVPEEAIEERNRLNNEVTELAADNRRLVGALAAADQRAEDYKSEVAKYVEENGDLRRQVKRLEVEVKAAIDARDRLAEELQSMQARAATETPSEDQAAASVPQKRTRRNREDAATTTN